MVLNLVTRTVVLIGLLTEVSVGQDSEIYRCPSHLTRDNYLKAYNGQCYYYSTVELTWNTAKGLCEDGQGHLIEIRDQSTQNWVSSTLTELQWPWNGVWIGAHDTNKDTVWTWVSGDTITWSYWATGQPSCYSAPLLCDEFCGNLRRDDSGRWHDKRCSSWLFMYSYICQYNMGPATTTTSQPSTTEITTTEELSTTTAAATTTTTTATTTKTSSSTTTTAKPSTTSEVTVTPTSSSSNQSRVDAVKKDEMSTAALSGVVFACVLGAFALLLLVGVCFYKSRKKEKGGDSVAVYFDNIMYSIRTVLSSQSRMRGHEHNLNNQVERGSQNVYADINEYAVTSLPSTTKEKELNHYSEIDDKLSVKLPKTDNNEYQKCNIAKSKLGYNDKAQYLDAYVSHKGNSDKTQYLDAYESKQDNSDKTQYLDAYESKRGDNDTTQYLDACENNMYDTAHEEVCNSMNEQLEASKNRYDESGYVERGDNLPNHYVDIDDTRRVESVDGPTLHSQREHSINAEYANGQPLCIHLGNCEGTLDLAKPVSGFTNNTYDTNA